MLAKGFDTVNFVLMKRIGGFRKSTKGVVYPNLAPRHPAA
jgi:hypothetical protein